ncbi:MAG TPA: S41 family peptidase [Chthoniobacterales bacterium]|nr:S41 family peptidase [Chthoniobacterales bacterium]
MPTATPAIDQLVNSLGGTDVQAAITLLKANFVKSDALTDEELNRALLQGLLVRYARGLQVLSNPATAPAEPAAPFYSEIFEGHIGYLRFGALNSANLTSLDKKLEEFAAKKTDAMVVDLRDNDSASDFAAAAEFAKRFCPKGKLLFTLRKPAARQDRAFSSDREPAVRALIVVLIDTDTSGAAEAVATALHTYNKALLIGQPTAGRAVEYADLPLPSGKILRVATAETVGPDGQLLFPDGVKPDLPVEMARSDKRQIFALSAEKGMAPFVYETERPHLNEAALITGTNPELESGETQRRNRGREKLPVRDPVLQRALDVIASLEIFQKR